MTQEEQEEVDPDEVSESTIDNKYIWMIFNWILW